MGWYRLHWFLMITAPWLLATGIMVSFTASAGQPDASQSLGLEAHIRDLQGQGGSTLFQPEAPLSPPASTLQTPRFTGDGATPLVARALALSSSTPLPAELAPIEIAAAPVSRPHHPFQPEPARQTAYIDLISPDAMRREQQCLAEAVYFEARGESEEGQAAVAQVVLNRAKSGLYPSSICGVVYQNRHRHLACQFTFACEGKALRTNNAAAWEQAQRIAQQVTKGQTYLPDVGASTHYHADYVRPHWAKRLEKMDVIGRHIFYKLKPGQT
jgi:hypothetical protein